MVGTGQKNGNFPPNRVLASPQVAVSEESLLSLFKPPYFHIFLGADPEFFLWDLDAKRPIPASLHFGPKESDTGYLDDPKVPNRHQYFFRDGYAVEVNPPFSRCIETLTCGGRRALYHLTNEMRMKRVALISKPTVKVDLEELKRIAPPDLMRWGCNPTYNAYDSPLRENRPAVAASDCDLRYSGGHIHLSVYNPDSEKWKGAFGGKATTDLKNSVLSRYAEFPNFVKLLDWKLAVPMSLIHSSEAHFERRKIYGQAGEFRFGRFGEDDPYSGLEYRVLSAEMWNQDYLISFVYRIARECVWRYDEMKKDLSPELSARVRAAVNSGSGLWDVLSEIPGIYDKKTIEWFINQSDRFVLSPDYSTGRKGFNWYRATSGVPVPKESFYGVYVPKVG